MLNKIIYKTWELFFASNYKEKYFKNGKVYVWKETFAIIKAKKPFVNAFANIIDKNETTVIIEQSKYDEENVIEIEKGWKILTFDMVLPFELVGFLAKVSKALADEKIPIFAVSAYSTDHILVKEKDLARAERKLKDLGCIVKEK
ncbi:MAG: ACT domain-containing protein [Candidatus Atribacteria bacterium]